MFKRWMSALLAIAMCVSMLPTTAFAEEATETVADTVIAAEGASEISDLEPEQEPEQETESPPTEESIAPPAANEAAGEADEETEETEATEATEATEVSPVLCAHGVEGACAVCALEEQIAALPEADALSALAEGEKEALAAQLEALVEAYDALSAQQQEQVANIGKLMEVYQTFQGMMVMTTEEETQYVRPVAVHVNPENGEVSVGGTVTFTVETEGEGEVNLHYYLTKTTDFTPGKEVLDPFYDEESSERTFRYTFNEPGFYHLRVEAPGGGEENTAHQDGEICVGPTLYYGNAERNTYGTDEPITIVTELSNRIDSFDQIRFELLRKTENGREQVGETQYRRSNEVRERFLKVEVPVPEGGWPVGTYYVNAVVEYGNDVEWPNRHGDPFYVTENTHISGLSRDIETPVWRQEITFTPEISGDDIQSVSYTVKKDKEVLAESVTVEPGEDGSYSFTYTPETRGNLEVMVTLVNGSGETSWVGDYFYVDTYRENERPKVYTVGGENDHFFYGLDPIEIRLDLDDWDRENVGAFVWTIWSSTKQEGWCENTDEPVLDFHPEVGGHYNVVCQTFWKDDWIDDNGHVDFEIRNGAWYEGLEISDTQIHSGESVTFMIRTAGESDGKETYDFRLYDVTPNSRREEVASQLSESPNATFTIQEPGYYRCEVVMTCGDGTEYHDISEMVCVAPGMMMDYFCPSSMNGYGVDEDIEVLTELSGQGEFKQVRVELYREDQKVDTATLTYGEYMQTNRRPVQLFFNAPEGGWTPGGYRIIAFVEYLDNTEVQHLETHHINIVAGDRVERLEVSNVSPLVGEEVTVWPTFIGEGEFTEVSYDLQRAGKDDCEIIRPDADGKFRFVPEWEGKYGINFIGKNEIGQKVYASVSVYARGYYHSMWVEKYTMNTGDTLNAAVVFQSGDDLLNENSLPYQNVKYYSFTLTNQANGEVIQEIKQTSNRKFTYEGLKPGTYELYVALQMEGEDEVRDDKRIITVGQLDVLRGVNPSLWEAPVGSTITFTPAVMSKVDSFIYRIYKQVGEDKQPIYEGKATTAASFGYKFTAAGVYACEVEAKAGNAVFLSGCPITIYDGVYPNQVVFPDFGEKEAVINLKDSIVMDLKTVGSGSVTQVVYRIMRQGYAPEKVITLTGGQTQTTYEPRYAGNYHVDAEVTNSKGQTYYAGGDFTVRNGRYLVDVTGPDMVQQNEAATFQVRTKSTFEDEAEFNGIRSVVVNIYDDHHRINETKIYVPDSQEAAEGEENLTAQDEFTLTFQNSGYHELEIRMMNDQGDCYTAWRSIEVMPDNVGVRAKSLEMVINDWWEAMVNTEVKFRLDIDGDKSEIEKIDYLVVRGDTADLSQCVNQQQYWKLGTKDLEFTFKPTKAGYYFVCAEVTSTSGYVSTSQWANCWVSASKATTAQVSAPNGSNGMYKVGEPITITGKYTGKSKITGYKLMVYEYKYDMDTVEQWEEKVYESDLQKGATFTWKPERTGVYYFVVEMYTADGVDIHSTYYSVSVGGEDGLITAVTYDKMRVNEGDTVTAHFQYQGDTSEIAEREIRIQKRLMGDDGYLYVPDDGLTRIPGDERNLDSYTMENLEPGFYIVGVYTKNSSGNEMSVYAMELFQVMANDEQDKLQAGELTVKSPVLPQYPMGRTYNEVKVNTPVTVTMSTTGTGTIMKTSYGLFYSPTPDRNSATPLEYPDRKHTEAHESKNPDPCLEYTFKPTKAGYYWILGDLRTQDNLLTSTDYLEIKVSATTALEMQLSKPDLEDGAYTAGKEIAITAKYAGTKPTGYKLTVKRDNAELEEFVGADFEYEAKYQTTPTFHFVPEVSGMYQFLMEITTADGMTLNSFAYVPVVGNDKHVSGISFQYDQYNVGDDVTVNFDYEGEGEITDMLIWVLDTGTKDVIDEKYIDAPTGDEQASYTFKALQAGTYKVEVFTHNDADKQNMSTAWSDSVVTVLEDGAHWYVPHPVDTKEATDEAVGTEGYLYYTCARVGHEEELFDENKNSMTQDELAALVKEKTVYYLGGKLVIQKGDETLEKKVSWDMADVAEISLTALRTPEVSTNQEAGVTWDSSSKAVATVDVNGNVEFKKPGTVTITAKAKDGSKLTAAVTFTVTYRISDGAIVASLAETTDIFEEPSKNGIQVNDSVKIVAKGKASGNTIDSKYLTFTATSGGNLIDEGELAKGVIMATGTGTAKITVSIDGDPLGRKATLSVKLVAMKPDSCELIIDEGSMGTLEDDGWIEKPGFVEESGGYTLYARMNGQKEQTFNIAAKALKTKLENMDFPITAGSFTWKSTVSSIKVLEDKTTGYVTVIIPKNVTTDNCVITATSKLNSNVKASFNVKVINYAPTLTSTSLTMNTKLEGSSASVTVKSVDGNAVKDVVLQEYDNGEKKYNASKDLKAEYVDGVVTFTLVNDANTLPDKKVIKLRLLANTDHQTHDMGDIDPYKAPILNLTIVVKNAEPTVTITQTKKGNLAAFDSAGELTITAKNGTEVLTITDVEFAEDANLGFAKGEKDESVTDSYVVSVERVEGKPAKNAKCNLVITVEGYKDPIQKSFTIGTTNTVPSLTMNSYLKDASVYVDLPSELANSEPLFVDKDSKSETKNGLKVEPDGDKLRIYPEDNFATLPKATHTLEIQVGKVKQTVKVTVKNVAPKVTVSQTKKFNLADEDSYALLNVAASDGNGVQEVTSVELAANATAFDFVTGELDTDNDGMWKIEKTSEGSGKANKAKLTISVDGYRYQTVKTLSIATENIADKVVLDKPKVTMYLGVTDMSETVKVGAYHFSSDMDLNGCVLKDKSTASTKAEYEKLDVSISDGQISISFNAEGGLPKATTYKYNVVDPNTDGMKPVELQVVVANGLPKVALKTTTAKFSTADFGERELSLAVTAPDAGGYKLSRFEVPEEYKGKLFAEYDEELQAMVISLAEDCGLAPKTYTVKLTPVYENESYAELQLAAVTLKITVTK